MQELDCYTTVNIGEVHSMESGSEVQTGKDSVRSE